MYNGELPGRSVVGFRDELSCFRVSGRGRSIVLILLVRLLLLFVLVVIWVLDVVTLVVLITGPVILILARSRLIILGCSVHSLLLSLLCGTVTTPLGGSTDLLAPLALLRALLRVSLVGLRRGLALLSRSGLGLIVLSLWLAWPSTTSLLIVLGSLLFLWLLPTMLLWLLVTLWLLGLSLRLLVLLLSWLL